MHTRVGLKATQRRLKSHEHIVLGPAVDSKCEAVRGGARHNVKSRGENNNIPAGELAATANSNALDKQVHSGTAAFIQGTQMRCLQRVVAQRIIRHVACAQLLVQVRADRSVTETCG